MPARPKRPKPRKRRLASLDSDKGKAEAREAALWFENFNRAEGKELKSGIAEAGHLSGNDGGAGQLLLATRFLPGYAAALESAKAALVTLCGRTPIVRELHLAATMHGDGQMDFANEALLSLAGYGNGTHSPALCDAYRWHERRGTRRSFLRNLNARQANGARKPWPNLKAPLGDVPDLPLVVARLWVSAGLWLTNSEDAAAVLDRQGLQPGHGTGKVTVSGDHIRRSAYDLRLFRYEGTGRFVFRDGGLCADAKLRDELTAAFSTTRCNSSTTTV